MAKIVFALNIAAKFFIGPRDLTFYRHMVCQTVRQPLRGFSIIINGRKGLTYSYDNIINIIKTFFIPFNQHQMTLFPLEPNWRISVFEKKLRDAERTLNVVNRVRMSDRCIMS